MQVWQARAGRRFTGPVVVTGGTIYGAGLDRKVYAVEVESGRTRWSSRLGGLVGGGVLVSGDTVFAASSRPEGRVYALDAESGHRFWRTRVGPVSAPLALAHGVLLAETQTGQLIGLDPAEGDVRWRRKLGVARVAAVPADSGTFVVATVDSLFRISAADGRVVRRATSPGTVLSPWVRHAGLLVGGTTDSTVVAVGIDDLHPHWKAALDAPVLDSPALAGGAILAATRRGTVYRITLDSTASAHKLTELEWPVTAPVVWYDGLILLGGADGVLRALRPDGEEAWRLQLRWPIELAPLPLPDGLLAIGGGGDLHRYRR
ncbi:MAG TPA: PQQ-binding-like beta-propeller repeat protein [Gemmatimonadales bacterium]|nr:PQQ-binding-like beta-propeller repeat protein [Gemmatimonadales bacterium]